MHVHSEIWLTLGGKAERCEIQPRDTYGCPRARELREARPTSTADQRHPVKHKHTLESCSQDTAQLSEIHLGEKDNGFLLCDGAGEDGVMTAVGGQRAAILLATENPDSSLAFSRPPKR